MWFYQWVIMIYVIGVSSGPKERKPIKSKMETLQWHTLGIYEFKWSGVGIIYWLIEPIINFESI